MITPAKERMRKSRAHRRLGCGPSSPRQRAGDRLPPGAALRAHPYGRPLDRPRGVSVPVRLVLEEGA